MLRKAVLAHDPHLQCVTQGNQHHPSSNWLNFRPFGKIAFLTAERTSSSEDNAMLQTPRGRTNNSGRHMFVGGPDVRHTGKATLAVVKPTSKQTALGRSVQQNVVLSRKDCHRHEPAPLSLYNGHTTASRYILDHNNCGQKNDGQTGFLCVDKAVLA